jgi:biotin transport system substrate-specific component
VVGYLAAKGFTASAPKVILAFAAGSAVIYFFGVVGLMASLNLNLFAALSAGVVPFLIGDAVKAIAAAALLPTAWKLTNKN